MGSASLLVWLVFLVTGCATHQVRFVAIGAPQTPHPADCSVDIYRGAPPTRDFIKISRIDVHLEKTHWIGSGLDDAMPELKRQACLSGADGILDIEESSRLFNETRIYHVTATGIRYK